MRRMAILGTVLGLIGWAMAGRPHGRDESEGAGMDTRSGKSAQGEHNADGPSMVDPDSHQQNAQQATQSDEDRERSTSRALQETRTAVNARVRRLMDPSDEGA
jgi:hypothetical protein